MLGIVYLTTDISILAYDYSVGRNVILAHANAVKVYREDFKPHQKGQIGITLNGDWAMPYDDNQESKFKVRSKSKLRNWLLNRRIE